MDKEAIEKIAILTDIKTPSLLTKFYYREEKTLVGNVYGIECLACWQSIDILDDVTAFKKKHDKCQRF